MQHWARVAHGNLEAAAALGPLVAFCAADTPVEPVDMTTMSTLVSHLRARDATSTLAVRRLTASAVANLLVSSHNQRLVIECNGIKPLVSLCQEAPEPELQAQVSTPKVYPARPALPQKVYLRAQPCHKKST